MELNMTMPQETKEYIDNLIKDEIEQVRAQIVEEGEKIKKDYIPRTDVAKFKAHIIEYHTDEEGRYFKNAYIRVEELVKLIDTMLLKGDQKDVKL